MLDGQQTRSDGVDAANCGPESVRTAADLTQTLEMLRRRAARGTRRTRVSLDDIATRSGVPRSTVHSYLHGVRLPPPDVLDAIVVALGAQPPEQRAWAQALERVVTDGSPATERSAPTAGSHGAGTTPHLLPMTPQGFLVRDAELAELDRLVSPAWSDPPAPAVLVGLCGTGGVGKTALALRFAHQVAAHFPDGQLWLDLRGFGPGKPVDPSTALARMLGALGVDVAELTDDVDFRADAYRSALTGRRVLVVLDNARDAAQTRHLLPGSPGCATIVTSRSGLRRLVVGEGAHRIEVSRLPHDEARRLATADSLPGDAAAVRTLVEACDGLPLALRILRERLTGAGAEQIVRLAAQFDDRRARLREFDLGDDDGEGGGVAAVVQSSYDTLSPESARLLRCLTLTGSSSIDVEVAAAAGGVGPDRVVPALDRLAGAGLLDRAGPRLYRLHDLIAAFVHERSEEQDGPAQVAGALTGVAQYFGEQLDEVSRTINPSALDPDARSGTRQYATVEAATQWLIAALPIIAGLAESNARSEDPRPVWELLARAQRIAHDHVATEVLLEAFRVCSQDAERRADPSGQSNLLQRYGICATTQGDVTGARAAFERAVALAEQVADPELLAKSLTNLAQMETRLGHAVRALELRERGRLIMHDSGREANRHMLIGLAKLHLQVGDLSTALDYAQQTLDVDRRDGDLSAQAGTLYLIGGILMSEGDLVAAGAAAAECLRTATSGGVRNTIMSAHVLGAAVQLELADVPAAAGCIERARAVPITETVVETVDLYVVAGRVLTASGRPEQALAEHRTAVRTARNLSIRFQEVIATLNVARSLSRLDDHLGARAEATAARDLAAECGYLRLKEHAESLMAGLD